MGTVRKPDKPDACRACRHCCGMNHPGPIKKADTQGACRRFPAQIVPVMGSTQSMFPIVRLDWSCGEFEQR